MVHAASKRRALMTGIDGSGKQHGHFKSNERPGLKSCTAIPRPATDQNKSWILTAAAAAASALRLSSSAAALLRFSSSAAAALRLSSSASASLRLAASAAAAWSERGVSSRDERQGERSEFRYLAFGISGSKGRAYILIIHVDHFILIFLLSI